MERIIIINKFGPSSKSITGRSARALADMLISKGHNVSFLSLDAEYKSEKKVEEKGFSGSSIKLRSWYNGTNPLIRLLFSLIDGFRLILASNRMNADHRIIMTDPPLLYFWTTFFKKKFRNEIYWTMDLYPEAFVSGNYISPSNYIYKYILKRVYSHKPDLVIALGEVQGRFLDQQYGGEIAKVILPCGIISFDRNVKAPEWKTKNQGMIIFGYGGNISEAHDANFLKTFINSLDDQRHRIILNLYGSKKEEVLSSVQNPSVVIKLDNISFQDQHFIDVNIASLLPQWNNICVPSKAVTAICCQSSLLINSSNASEAWHMFNSSSWLIESSRDYKQSVREYLSNLNIEEIIKRRFASSLFAVKMLKMESFAYERLNSFLIHGILPETQSND